MTIKELIDVLEELAECEGDDAGVINNNNIPIEEAVTMFDGRVKVVTSDEYMQLLQNNFSR
jgi:hypothetical protein